MVNGTARGIDFGEMRAAQACGVISRLKLQKLLLCGLDVTSIKRRISQDWIGLNAEQLMHYAAAFVAAPQEACSAFHVETTLCVAA